MPRSTDVGIYHTEDARNFLRALSHGKFTVKDVHDVRVEILRPARDIYLALVNASGNALIRDGANRAELRAEMKSEAGRRLITAGESVALGYLLGNDLSGNVVSSQGLGRVVEKYACEGEERDLFFRYVSTYSGLARLPEGGTQLVRSRLILSEEDLDHRLFRLGYLNMMAGSCSSEVSDYPTGAYSPADKLAATGSNQ